MIKVYLLAFIFSTLLLLISVIGSILLLTKREKGKIIDYFERFIIGSIWLLIGICLKDFLLIVLGIIFVGFSYNHKKNWKKNHRLNSWNKLSKTEKQIKKTIMLMLTILILLGLIYYLN